MSMKLMLRMRIAFAAARHYPLKKGESPKIIHSGQWP
jgi:hypothetical protein